MNRGTSAIVLSLFLLAVTAAAGHMTAMPPYDLSWHTIDGGGGVSSGGAFTLSGSIGQPDAGVPMSGGSFSLTGGFFAAASAPACPADLDGNGAVDVVDLLGLLGAWGTCGGCPADLDSDGLVTVVDLLALLGAWGACP